MTPDNANFMYAAYVLIGALHVGYAITLWRRHAQTRERLARARKTRSGAAL